MNIIEKFIIIIMVIMIIVIALIGQKTYEKRDKNRWKKFKFSFQSWCWLLLFHCYKKHQTSVTLMFSLYTWKQTLYKMSCIHTSHKHQHQKNIYLTVNYSCIFFYGLYSYHKNEWIFGKGGEWNSHFYYCCCYHFGCMYVLGTW